MYIGSAPVLHIVDEATRFQAARWLSDMSAKHSFEMLRNSWIDVYTGPPDLIVHDAGTNFESAEFKQSANSMAIRTRCVPVEAHNTISPVERYHAPLRRAYEIITAELRTDTCTKEVRLQMAVKAVNDTAGYDGLVPTLLVFGAYPRISSGDAPALSNTRRAHAIKLAMAELANLRAKRQVTDALRLRNGPRTDKIHDTPIGSMVLVYREKHKTWLGPYKLLSVTDENCVVELVNGPTTFRSVVVKPYLEDPESDLINDRSPAATATDTPTDSLPTPDPSFPRKRGRPRKEVVPNTDNHEDVTDGVYTPPSESIVHEQPKRGRGRPRKHPEPAQISVFHLYATDPVPSPNYEESRQKELNGLLDRGVFQVRNRSEVPPGTRIFGSRFVDEIKFKGTEKAFEKSRLVVQAFNDSDKAQILTQAPTIMRSSQRVVLVFALALDLGIFLRDISQAYTQSTSVLNRRVFIRAPAEMNLSKEYVVEVLLPLYGIPEAGTHWFRTYHDHHTNQLGMTASTFDNCLLYRTDGSALVGLQTDDSLIAAGPEFIALEESELYKAKFLAKPIEQLTVLHPVNFNGFIITLDTGTIRITQAKQAAAIQLLIKSFTTADYVSQRARGAYIATVSQPQAAFDLSFAAQVTEPTWEDAQYLNKRLG